MSGKKYTRLVSVPFESEVVRDKTPDGRTTVDTILHIPVTSMTNQEIRSFNEAIENSFPEFGKMEKALLWELIDEMRMTRAILDNSSSYEYPAEE
jgi:hypothetical protein